MRVRNHIGVENIPLQKSVRQTILQSPVDRGSVALRMQNLKGFQLFFPIYKKLGFIPEQSEKDHLAGSKTRHIAAHEHVTDSIIELFEFDFVDVPIWSQLP